MPLVVQSGSGACPGESSTGLSNAAERLPALRTEQDSRRTRGLKSACLTGAFIANQRKPANLTTS
jgi:hypothetical protein